MSDREPDLERQIINGIHAALSEATKRHIEGGYHGTGPMTKMLERVFAKNESALESIVTESFQEAFSGEFRQNLRAAMAHKLAKTIISKSEGEIEKRANDLRSDPAFRARLTIAITQAVNDASKPPQA